MGWLGASLLAIVLSAITYKIFFSSARTPSPNVNKTETTEKTFTNGVPVELRLDDATMAADMSLDIDQRHSTHKSIPPFMARPNSPPRLKPPTAGSLAPPSSRMANGSALRPPPSAASTLRVPQTKVLNNTSMAPSSLMLPPKKPSRKVVLQPGHSPMDWAALTSRPNHKLRGSDVPEGLIKIPPSMLKHYNGRKGRDAWATYQGKVYNISPYLPYHPGGEGELMRGAGKDAEKLFVETHPWVNWDGMLGECLVGILVSEADASANTGGLDDMD